jgi:hypothetical protein
VRKALSIVKQAACLCCWSPLVCFVRLPSTRTRSASSRKFGADLSISHHPRPGPMAVHEDERD